MASRHWLTLGMAVIAFSASPATSTHGDSELNAALDFFTRHEAARTLERLDAMRPAPVSAVERTRVLATLPAEGEVANLNLVQRTKLAAVRRVLELHGREAVYVVKVVVVPQAAVALHARSVVLVSETALDILDAGELQALVAHEIGHEYFWSEYSRARRDDHRSLLRTLELVCDGVAVVTLRRAGGDAGQLISALGKVVRYNRARFGTALDEDRYPAIETRRTFSIRLVKWLEPDRAPS